MQSLLSCNGSLEGSKAFFREALQDNKQSLLSCNGVVVDFLG
jgi:hypothetical protein